MFNDQEIIDLINKKIINNSKISEFVKSHNETLELDIDSPILRGEGGIFDREDYLLMLQFGVPVGILEYQDSKGNVIIDEEKDVDKVKYKPINSIQDYFEYLEIDPFPDLIVNPNYMSKKEARNVAYCLSYVNNDEIFDFETKNKLQLEIINHAPLKYRYFMKIFNKYYDETIQRKFIYKYGVKKSRFYYLSGLNKLVKDNKNLEER